ncbi:MAG: tRNA pseudouridine(38-40) synthase TruA [Bryobacter sp.]|nr:tRNA pseudouridine(38-40) synthase TruA [Bryobacter sp.]
MTFRLTLEYDGTKYSGWQEQTNARTVAGVLRAAFEEVLGERVELMGSGRTDAGVHALAQVAHLRLKHKPKLPLEPLLRAVNDRLPSDVVLLELAPAPPRFHARHDALTRTYLYQISIRRTAFGKRHVWWVKPPLNVDRMAEAAALLAGRHDFRNFVQADPSKPGESTIVVVQAASVVREDDLILFRITASHFLWRMVRRLVGALVKVGLGEVTLDDFRSLLAGDPRPELPVAAWTAPASGLFLESVEYP